MQSKERQLLVPDGRVAAESVTQDQVGAGARCFVPDAFTIIGGEVTLSPRNIDDQVSPSPPPHRL